MANGDSNIIQLDDQRSLRLVTRARSRNRRNSHGSRPGYTVWIARQPNGIYVAAVLALWKVIEGYGVTREEALETVRENIRAYVEHQRERRLPLADDVDTEFIAIDDP